MQKAPPWIFIWTLICLISLAKTVDWDANNFPNPTATGFRECNMKMSASICDPDGILSESQRYRLNHELNQLEARTRQDHAGNFCEKKGITGAMAIAKHFRDGSEASVKAAANEMLRKWDLDRQCRKAVVIVLATEDKKFWVARGDKVPIYGDEFTELFNAQKSYFKEGNYDVGMQNILQGTWEKALSKQTGGRPDSGRGKPQPPPFSDDTGRKEKEGMKMPGIPWGWIALLLLVVIPIVLCCCCIYCCCCRGRGGASGRTDDAEGGGPMMGGGGPGPMPSGGGGGGGRSAGLGGFLGGMGGSAAMNGIMGLIRNRGGGGGGGGSSIPMNPPPYSPPAPGEGNNPTGKGLYPSVSVKDEGGGGSW
uniref:TPM domain-containing protein n=1 Tax=Panagrolaimus sp. JU765 TaxID=591449 RepID=A0AC34QTY1_9BILA